MDRMDIRMKKIQLYRALGHPLRTRARSRMSQIRPLINGLRLGLSIVEGVEGWWNLEGVKKREINLLTAVFFLFFSHMYRLVITSMVQNCQGSMERPKFKPSELPCHPSPVICLSASISKLCELLDVGIGENQVPYS